MPDIKINKKKIIKYEGQNPVQIDRLKEVSISLTNNQVSIYMELDIVDYTGRQDSVWWTIYKMGSLGSEGSNHRLSDDKVKEYQGAIDKALDLKKKIQALIDENYEVIDL